MKYILVIGTKDAGKSTTIGEACKQLLPTAVKRLNGGRTFEEDTLECQILNGTYLLQVSGKWILVCAGAPTEQSITITVLIDLCIKIEISVSLAIVAMRSFERSEGFSTKQELEMFGKCIWQERIYQVPGEDFKQNPAWKNRIQSIVQAAAGGIN